MKSLASIMFVTALLSLPFTGCGSNNVGSKVDRDLVLISASVSVEGTVLSLDLTPNISEFDGGNGFPTDAGMIQIDSVTSIDNPAEIDISAVNVGESPEVTFEFGARPARIERIASPPVTNGDLVSCSVEQFFTLDGDVSVYRISDCNLSNSATLNLAGLTVGGRFGAIVTVCPSCPESKKASMGSYEILPLIRE